MSFTIRSSFSSFAAVALALLLGACASSSGSEGAAGGPVIDNLDVPATTTPMTLQGQTGPGVVITLTAHDDDSGLTALHVVFVETKADHPITLPNAPTSVTDQKIELVIPGAPSGAHEVTFHLEDAKGRSSAPVTHTITVP
jgi:hypothetical protein